MAPRQAISKRVRFETFKRDKFCCMYCGRHPPNVLLQIDHIVAVAVGGTNDPMNLVTACQSCNLGKGARDLNQTPQALADKAAAIVEREEQLLAYQDVMNKKRERLDKETWTIVHIMYPASDDFRRDWFGSVKRFVERIGFDEVYDAADKAAEKGISHTATFKYFCGICWNKVTQIEGPRQ